MKAIILAGGSGERFWPESSRNRPKQFLELYGKGSLLERTANRLLRRIVPEDIYVITSREHRELSMTVLPFLPRENVVGEPLRRNTAAACALGALLTGDEVQIVAPADHLISDEEGFWSSVDKAVRTVDRMGGLVTFGIRPRSPHTGYGYIEAGEELERGVFSVSSFREKPDPEAAERFLDSGGFYWNSGMFVWKGSDLLNEMARTEPAVHGPIAALGSAIPEGLDKAYSSLPSISVDHAVLERSDKVRMVEADFGWDDIGSWTSIADIEGETRSSEGIFVEGEGVYVRSGSGRPVAVLGLSGIIVVDSPNGLLVCSREKAQDVRSAASHFRKRDREKREE